MHRDILLEPYCCIVGVERDAGFIGARLDEMDGLKEDETRAYALLCIPLGCALTCPREYDFPSSSHLQAAVPARSKIHGYIVDAVE